MIRQIAKRAVSALALVLLTSGIAAAETLYDCTDGQQDSDEFESLPCEFQANNDLWHDADTHNFCREDSVSGCDVATECLGRCGPGCGPGGAGAYQLDCAEHDLCCRAHGDCFNPLDSSCGDEWQDAADDFIFGPRTCGACSLEGKVYSVTGGGGQLQIGRYLPLPLQPVLPTVTQTLFPSLLIPVAPHHPVVHGSTAMTAQQRLTIPTGVLSRPAIQNTLGVFPDHPVLYAVATNLSYRWPSASAVLSTNARTGAKTTTFVTPAGSNIRYSNALASKFGGPARFAFSYGAPAGVFPQAPVTLYGIILPGLGDPPCAHPFFGGTNSQCVAALCQWLPASQGVIGGPVSTFVTTPGGTPNATAQGGPIPGAGPGVFNTAGSVVSFAPVATVMGFTDMASSFGYPWTTGMLTLSASLAVVAPEFFTLTGGDNRTAGGVGTIKLVAGGLSHRVATGPNANRGWIRLKLSQASEVPTMSPAGLVAAAGLILLAVGYVRRRSLSR